MAPYTIVTVTPDNIGQEGIFCLKNPKHPGFRGKAGWYMAGYAEGLRIRIIKDETGRPAGFIEYVPGEYAWRPVAAPDYLFVHCLWVYPRSAQAQGFGTALIEACLEDARSQGQAGVAVMTSDGAWMAGMEIFLDSGFNVVDRRDRFELLAHKLHPTAPDPHLLDWTADLPAYRGWRLLYADQCPMHAKSAADLLEEARELGIRLTVTKLHSALEAQQTPSGFGVYALIHNGKLLQDHYVSRARFRNLVKEEGE